MKHLLNSAVKALMILFIIFIMGLFVPMLITTLLVILTKTTYTEVITESVVFWLFTIIGWFMSAIFVNDELNDSMNCKNNSKLY